MKGFRTLAFNIAILIGAAVELLAQILPLFVDDPSLMALVPQNLVPVLVAAVAIANIYLRIKTSTPVGRAE